MFQYNEKKSEFTFPVSICNFLTISSRPSGIFDALVSATTNLELALS